MKILITGVTARMIGSTRLRYNYLSNVSLIEKALHLAGHEVETRKVALYEEDIEKKFDVALVGMAPTFSLGAGYYPEATRVLQDFGPRAAIYADDWSFVGFGETVRGCLRGWAQWCKWRNYSHTTERDMDRLRATLYDIGDGQCRWPVMIPMFAWGNPMAFMEGNLGVVPEQICAFDPTSLYDVPNFNPISLEEKEFKWVMAALGNHDAWLKKLNLWWPIEKYGNKRLDQPVLTEDQVIQRYSHCFGVLAAKYPKAGTGWWRVRYIHAAETHSVLLCDPEDGLPIGPSYCTSPAVIEDMSDKALWDLARAQRSELYSHTPTADVVSQQISDFVKGLSNK